MLKTLVLVTATLLAGCTRKTPERLDRVYATAQADLLAADTSGAESGAKQGIALARERGDRLFEWRFRLIRVEALLLSGRPKPALADLGERIPQSPEFAAVGARKLMLEGWATKQIQGIPEGRKILERARQAAESAHSAELLAEIENLEGSWLSAKRQF